MNISEASNWVNKMGQAWVDKKPEAIPPLFAEKFEYFENPFEKPITSKKELLALWQDVPHSQRDIIFDFEILSETNRSVIAHFHASFTRIKTGSKAVLDGIFSVQLDKKALATEFKWWWNTREF